MRTLFGMIVGVLLTVATAYVSNSTRAVGEPRMVNWEMVNTTLQNAGTHLRDGWARLTARLERDRTDGTAGESRS